jgi:hypothetical protein
MKIQNMVRPGTCGEPGGMLRETEPCKKFVMEALFQRNGRQTSDLCLLFYDLSKQNGIFVI